MDRRMGHLGKGSLQRPSSENILPSCVFIEARLKLFAEFRT